MKILVIDDNPIHQQSARQTLGAEHDLTVIGTHDEARGALYHASYNSYLKSSCQEILRQQGMPVDYGAAREVFKEDEEKFSAWKRAEKAAEKEAYWDVVLCDLIMPAGRNVQGGEGLQYVGQKMPVGWSLALDAAKNGAKFVAVVTDTNHHHHPASAMLDRFNQHIFEIDGAKVLMTNYVGKIGISGTEKTCIECDCTGKKRRSDNSVYDCHNCNGTGTDYVQKGKNWAGILKQVMCSDAAVDSIEI